MVRSLGVSMSESMLRGLMLDLRGDAASMLRKIATDPDASNKDMVNDCIQVCHAIEYAERAVRTACLKVERSMSVINSMK